MAGMKSWLEKIKNRILKKDLDDDLLKSKIQSEEKIANGVANKKELPDLITPTSEKIEQTPRRMQKENDTQKPRKEAMKVSEMHGCESEKIIESKLAQTQNPKGIDKGFVHFTDVPKRTRRT